MLLFSIKPIVKARTHIRDVGGCRQCGDFSLQTELSAERRGGWVQRLEEAPPPHPRPPSYFLVNSNNAASSPLPQRLFTVNKKRLASGWRNQIISFPSNCRSLAATRSRLQSPGACRGLCSPDCESASTKAVRQCPMTHGRGAPLAAPTVNQSITITGDRGILPWVHKCSLHSNTSPLQSFSVFFTAFS